MNTKIPRGGYFMKNFLENGGVLFYHKREQAESYTLPEFFLA